MFNIKKISLFFSLLIFASHGLFAPNNRHKPGRQTALDLRRQARGAHGRVVNISPGTGRWGTVERPDDLVFLQEAEEHKGFVLLRPRDICCSDKRTKNWLKRLFIEAPASDLILALGETVARVQLSLNRPVAAVLHQYGRRANSTLLQIWNSVSGKLINSWYIKRTTSVSFSPNGRFVAAPLCCSACVGIWDIESGRLIHHLADGHVGMIAKSRGCLGLLRNPLALSDAISWGFPLTDWHHSQVLDVKFSPNGQTVFVGHINSIKWWDLRTGLLLQTLPIDRQTLIGHEFEGITRYKISFSTDGQHILARQQYGSSGSGLFGQCWRFTGNCRTRSCPQAQVQLFLNDYAQQQAICAICQQRDFIEHDLRLAVLPCAHYYHAECLDGWLAVNPTCPTCRAPDINYTRPYVR